MRKRKSWGEMLWVKLESLLTKSEETRKPLVSSLQSL
jgi:hypothetical protein